MLICSIVSHIYIAITWYVDYGEDNCYMQCIICMVWYFLCDCHHISYVGVHGRITEIIKWVLILLEVNEVQYCCGWKYEYRTY